jgi:hypothetical protein
MDGIGDHHVKKDKLHSQKQVMNVFYQMHNLDFFKKWHRSRGEYLGRGKGPGGKRIGDKRGWQVGDYVQIHHTHIFKCHNESYLIPLYN